MYLSSLPFKIVLDILAHVIRQGKERYRIVKEEIKLSFFIDNMTMNVDNQKQSIDKLLKLTII